MASSIYNLSSQYLFRSSGVEKKYLQQTRVYFQTSLNVLMICVPVCLSISNSSVGPLLAIIAHFLFHSRVTARVLVYVSSILYSDSLIISLLGDWMLHVYTTRDPRVYLLLSIARVGYWRYQGVSIGADNLIPVIVLVYLAHSTQLSFRKLWAGMETNKRRMMQQKTVLNEIQNGVIVFTINGIAITANHKACLFLKTRGINCIKKLRYSEVVPVCYTERIKNLFERALKGAVANEEFLISHELDPIPPMFSSVALSLKTIDYANKPSLQMTIIDMGNSIMRRRFLANHQTAIEENSVIIEEEFIDLYKRKQPLRNKHIRSLTNYFMSQRNLLVMMDNYLGESEVVNEFFDLRNEVINTVHSCWRGAKVKRMDLNLVCEKALPQQVFGDIIKHNQLLKAVVEFAVLTGEPNSEVMINCSLKKFIRGVSLEYRLVFHTNSLSQEELDFIFRIRKHSEQSKLLEEMIEISEKYGLGIVIFDVLLTITGGYIAMVDFQNTINRVIISYVLSYENVKDTESLLKGVCLYKDLSDGITYKWGKKPKICRLYSFANPREISNMGSISSDALIRVPEESIDEYGESEIHSHPIRSFVTSQHKPLFESSVDQPK